MTRPSVVAAVNPAAGNVDDRKLAFMRDYLREHCQVKDFILSRKAGDIEDISRQVSSAPGVDILVVAGGDGTLNEAVNGIIPGGPRLGYIPAGTTNVIRFELGIPGNLGKAMETALFGSPVRVKPGECNGRKFILMTGAGMDAEIVRCVTGKYKKRMGKGEYIRVGLNKFINARFDPIEVSRGSEFIGNFSWVVVARASHYAGLIRLIREASLDSGNLVAYMFRGGRFVDYLVYTVKSLAGSPFGDRHVVKASGSSFTLSSKGKVPYQLDGDFKGYLPVDVGVSDDWVEINVPAP